MITKLTIRNLQANKGRFAMTTFAVVLAVSFVVSAFVLGDGLRKTFDDLTTDIVAGTDLEVRPVEQFGSVDSLTDGDVAEIRATDGVADAVAFVEAPENSVRPITPAGEEIPTTGPPQLAFSWSETQGFSPFTLIDGAAPGPNEFVLDLDSAAKYDFEVGSSYAVVTSTGRHEVTLSGLTRFGEDNATLGAVLMAFNGEQTDELFGTVGYDSIAVALTDSARADLASATAAVQRAVPDLEVLTQATIADETSAEFNTQINLIQNILLGFAGVSLLVSIFIIGNTFAIVLQQRTREMGLLRLVGADASQLRRSALGEAGAIGVIASAIGIPGGIGVAAGLSALFGAIGASLPDYEILVPARTLLVAAGVGIGVTLIAAWWPTKAATQVPALSALRSGSAGRTPSYRRRTLAGIGLATLGLAAAALGVFGSGTTAGTVGLMAGGALAIFVGVTLVSPQLVGPVTSVFALALDRLGMPGRLASRNARRQAGRTATTATALMIGLAVVSMALVVGQSIKTQIGSSIETSVKADYLLTDQVADAGFPTTIVDELNADPAFAAATGFRDSQMQVAGEVVDVTATDFDAVSSLVDLAISAGALGDRLDETLVSREHADQAGVAIGDTIDVTMTSGQTAVLQVAGVFDEDALVSSDWIVDVDLFASAGVTANDSWIAFAIADGLSQADTVAAIDQLVQRYPQGELDTAAQFRDRMEGYVDQVLSVLNALIALAVVIALIGIANTLALSVSERTREIGLLRGVGMSSRGVRRMVRYESAIIAGFGAVLGVVTGIALGWLTVEALPDTFASTLAIPSGQILTLVLVAAIAGLGAALLPARRAGRMNVLAAIVS